MLLLLTFFQSWLLGERPVLHGVGGRHPGLVVGNVSPDALHVSAGDSFLWIPPLWSLPLCMCSLAESSASLYTRAAWAGGDGRKRNIVMLLRYSGCDFWTSGATKKVRPLNNFDGGNSSAKLRLSEGQPAGPPGPGKLTGEFNVGVSSTAPLRRENGEGEAFAGKRISRRIGHRRLPDLSLPTKDAPRRDLASLVPDPRSPGTSDSGIEFARRESASQPKMATPVAD